MAKSPKLLRDLGRYLQVTGYGWWLAVGALFGFWDQVAGLLPRVEWLQQMPGWLPIAVAVAALLSGPFLAFQRITRRLDAAIEARDTAQARFFGQLAEQKMETFYGEASRKTRAVKARELRQEWEPLAASIRAGDFRLAARVPPLGRYYLPLLHQIMPRGSAGYEKMEREIREVWELAEQYLIDIGADPPGTPPARSLTMDA